MKSKHTHSLNKHFNHIPTQTTKLSFFHKAIDALDRLENMDPFETLPSLQSLYASLNTFNHDDQSYQIGLDAMGHVSNAYKLRNKIFSIEYKILKTKDSHERKTLRKDAKILNEHKNIEILDARDELSALE